MPSSAANTPLMRPDMMRKAAMYCATLSWITSQPAMTTSSGNETVEQDERHGNAVHAEVIVDVECRYPGQHSRRTASPDVAVSKPVYSGIATTSPSTAPASAIQRASGCVAVGTGRQNQQPGKYGHPDDKRELAGIRTCSGHSVEPRKPRYQGEHADDHGKGVVVDVAGLESRDQAGEALQSVAPSH